MVINSKGKCRMIRCLLNSGCSKSVIFKKFTDKKQRKKLSKKDLVLYKIHIWGFVSSATATIPIRMVKFDDETTTHVF